MLRMVYREFPGGPVVRTAHFHCRAPHSIPGRGTKISQDEWPTKKRKKKVIFQYNVSVFRHLIALRIKGGRHKESKLWRDIINKPIYHIY